MKAYWIQSIKVVKFVRAVDAKAATTQDVRAIWNKHCVQPLSQGQRLASRSTSR
jgi:hypothetical protein